MQIANADNNVKGIDEELRTKSELILQHNLEHPGKPCRAETFVINEPV